MDVTVYTCELCGREDASWAVIMRCESDCLQEIKMARRGVPSPKLKPTSVRWEDFD